MRTFEEIKKQAKIIGYAMEDVSIPGEMSSIERMLEIQVRPDDGEIFYFLCDDQGRNDISESEARLLIR